MNCQLFCEATGSIQCSPGKIRKWGMATGQRAGIAAYLFILYTQTNPNFGQKFFRTGEVQGLGYFNIRVSPL